MLGAACGADAPDPGGVTGGACSEAESGGGKVLDLEWPAASNVGHEVTEGDTVHFHWTGSHNVLQVASFEGQLAPVGKFSDAGWPGQLKSGAKQEGGAFDWKVGSSPCGHRPGIYFFVDEDDPQGGITSVNFTVHDESHYAPRPCSVLADEGVHGGRYASFADRPGCTFYEVNNFLTEAHYDWVQPTFKAKQGDLILFRWTGEHNVVQVHDVDRDTLVPGGIDSGDKTNCVGGPGYTCVNGPPSLGEFLIDTTDYRPGVIHISDECAYTCTGHETGMNMQFDLRFPVPDNTPLPPAEGSCCAIDEAKGKACRVVEIYNGNDGAQLDYNVPVGRGDLVRFRWAGKLQIYQSLPNADGSPSKDPKPGGIAMPAPIECTPGPHMSCLEGTTDAAELVFDVNAQIASGNVEEDQFGQKFFTFHALGDNTPGYTSADTGTKLYIDESIPYDPDPEPCP